MARTQKEYDHEKIKKLLASGIDHAAICERIGCGKKLIERVIREMKCSQNQK